MEHIKTDLLVIGAGSGGLSVAAGAVQMGASVVLLEGHRMGGDCLNFGCVPSKALLAAAKQAHSYTQAEAMGVFQDAPEVDYAAVMSHVSRVIAQIEPVDSQSRFEGLGVRVIREYGHFVSPTEVEAGQHRITARRIVISTGSSPLVPRLPGLADVPYLTNETLFEQRTQPGHLLIIGGGPIGMEMAQAHRRLGSRVTVIEGAKALGRDDPELAAIALEQLRAEGVEIVENAMVAQVSGQAGAVTVETQDGRTFDGTHLLLAIGRRANTETLNLEAAGIETTPSGIKTDAGMRTTNRRVYAIGDVAGGMQFTHVAGYHAGVIIRSALFGLPSKAGTAHLPWATYTDPELAHVGLSEADARNQYGDKLSVARFEYLHNDRAIAERKTTGLIKVMVVRGRPVGASIVGHQAGDLIGFWSLAIAKRLKMADLSAMVVPYPSLSEINKRAIGAYFSPKLFDNDLTKRVVGAVQRWLP